MSFDSQGGRKAAAAPSAVTCWGGQPREPLPPCAHEQHSLLTLISL